MEFPQSLKLDTPAQILKRTDQDPVAELPVEFSWTANDPYAIRITFTEEGDEVVWTTDVDLFIGALADKGDGWHGEGDISVRFTETVCYVALNSDGEREAAIAKMSGVGLAPYFHRVARLCVLHKQYIDWLVNKELDALLAEEDA